MNRALRIGLMHGDVTDTRALEGRSNCKYTSPCKAELSM